MDLFVKIFWIIGYIFFMLFAIILKSQGEDYIIQVAFGIISWIGLRTEGVN